MARQQDYYTDVRVAARKLWEAINDLVALQREHTALDYGNTLEIGAGDNAGLTKVEVGAVTFDTANAIVAVFNAGHGTNVAKLL